MAGGFAAAQYVHNDNVVEAGGLRFPTVRRAYLRYANDSPVHTELLVSIDVSDLQLEGVTTS
ncbi:hypothetical protein [Streptomyces sp. NPDC096153]|uniref:hypothetical protein n=1 Tax=Streptomyces sp. NPDC096153 TaxID=3155548 RepID=UPI003333C842